MWISFLLMPEQTTTNLMVENNASSPHSSVSQKSSTDLSRVKSRYQQAAFFSGHCRRESISLPFPAFLGPPTFLGSWSLQFSSVQFISSVLSNSLWPHESQHTRPPCPSPTPGVHSNSCLSSRWCHLAISSSVVPFSSCPQSLPASGSFPMCQLFAWSGQSIEVSALASVLPMNTQDGSPLGWTY